MGSVFKLPLRLLGGTPLFLRLPIAVAFAVAMAIATSALFSSAPADAAGSTLYVDQASIGGACSDARVASQVTISTPWCTPARAIAAAGEGDTVILRAGTYTNVRAVDVARTQMLTLKAAVGETVTLAPANTVDLSARAINTEGSSNLRFEGFKITGGAYLHNSSFIQLVGNDIAGMGTRLRNVSDVLVENNVFHNFVGETRMFETTANVGELGALRVSVRGNEFRDGQYDAIALYWRLQDVTVEDNYIHDILRPAGSDLHTDAIQIAPQSEGAWGSVIVRRNRLLRYGQGLMIKDGITRGLTIENNLVGPPDVLTAHIYNAPSARIINNTFAAGIVYLREGTTGAVVTNNVMNAFGYDGNATGTSSYNLVDRTQYNPGYVAGPGDLNGRASFVDPANSNYRLTATSLGVDKATSTVAPLVDVMKAPRPSGPAADIGAYELQVAAPTPPPPPPPPAPAPAPVDFVVDSFTGTAGTLLSARTGETGATWTRHDPYGSGTAVLTPAGRVRSSGKSGLAAYYASGTPATSEYDVQATVTVLSTLSMRAGVTGRVNSAASTFSGARYD
jgi:hypothetical protein